jgi:hypothetical protein
LNPPNYWPFFLTALFPCLVILIGILINKQDLGNLRIEFHRDIDDVRRQIQHLIDLHIDHGERIAVVEERTKPK